MRRLLAAASLLLPPIACASPTPPPASRAGGGSAPNGTSATPSEDSPRSGHTDGYSGQLRRDCNALFQAWLDELPEDGAGPDPEELAEVEARAADFECDLWLDLDGDGRDEHVFITSDESLMLVGIGIEWGDGRSTSLGAGKTVEIRPSGEEAAEMLREESFGWLRHWEPAPLRNGAFEVTVLHRSVRFEAPDALGDGIEVSGSDAAAVFYFDGTGWRWIHLGF